MSRFEETKVGTALAASALVASRRARKDVAQLVTAAALVAVTTLLAVVAPGLMLDTLDEGARDAVARAGSSADVLAQVTVGAPRAGARLSSPDATITLAESMPDLLPPALSQVITSSSLSVLSGEVTVRQLDGAAWNGDGDLLAQLAMLTPQNTAALSLVDGRIPGARPAESRAPIEILISEASADATGLVIGSTIDFALPESADDADDPELVNGADGEPDPITSFEIVGIATEQAGSAASTWEDTPRVWTPGTREATPGARSQLRFTGLVSPDGLSAAELFLDYPLIGTVRNSIDPELFTSELAASTVEEVKALTAAGQSLAGDSLADVSVQSRLAEALKRYPAEARAALAQMSLMMAGVLGIAAVSLILLSRLLVGQRAAAIALERARGASVLSTGLRSLLESVAVTIAGSIVGVVVAVIVQPGGLRDLLPIAVVVLVAILAGPLQAMALARGLWTGRRDPANRRDRQLLATKRRWQRVVVEAAVIALAVASLVSIRSRGLLQNRTAGIDPLLVAAPLLLAIAVTIIVIRIYPFPVRAIGAVAQRTRGVLGLLGSVRARSAVAALPLLALALGSALSVTGGLLVDTVRNGQDEAAWQRVGADVRIDTELDADILAELHTAPGVDAVSATRSRGGVSLDLGTTTSTVTVVAIDQDYADVVDALPGQPNTDSLRELQPTTPDVLPILVDPETAGRLFSNDIAMYFGPAYITLEVVGSTSVAPDGYTEGPFAYVDREALAAFLPDPFPATRYLVMGDGAEAAAESLDVDQAAVLTWHEWIDDRRSLALVDGVERAMVFAVVAVALLSIVALVATVIGGARARGRALSMLRTLGMPPRLGWWLALAELGPLIAAAIIGGIVSGVVVMVTLTPAIGLDILAGGTSIPATSIAPTVFIALAAAGVVLLVLGALADVLVHRRDKLSEVLRVGETV